MLQEDLLKILPMINESNAMSEELDKKVKKYPQDNIHVKTMKLCFSKHDIWSNMNHINHLSLFPIMKREQIEKRAWCREAHKSVPIWPNIGINSISQE